MANDNRLLVRDPPKRIVVVRALRLGDMLCAVPALRALRAAAPGAEIALVGLAWARELAERLDAYLDDFLELPGWPGLPETPARLTELPAFLAEMQGRRFDLAVQLHGAGTVTNPLAVLLGARRTAGFHREGEWVPDPELFLRHHEGAHEVDRLLALVEHLGAPRLGDELEFPVLDDDRSALTPFFDRDAGGYVCVHPGGNQPGALWPAERFAAVADALAGRGLRVVLTGTDGERPLAERVASGMRARPVLAAGATTLGSLAALLEGARLLVSNDTGVVHLAAALGVPAVVVFRESQLARWGPRGPEPHRAVPKTADADDVVRVVDDLLASAVATR